MRTWLRRRFPKRSPRPIHRFRPELGRLEDRLAPAVLYLAPAADFQAASGGKVNFTPGPNQTVLLTPGTNAFTTLESAIDAANTNADTSNTLRVAPGTYTATAAQIEIKKDLSINGAGSTGLVTTTLQAGVSTGSSGDATAFLLVDRGVSFNLSQVVVDGQAPTDITVTPTVSVSDAIRYTETSTATPAPTPVASLIDHVAFRNIRGGTPSTGFFDGFAVDVRNGTVTVADSTFDNIGRVGVSYFDADAADAAVTGGSFLGNTYTGKGAGNTLDYAVQVSGGANVTIQGNTIQNNLGVATVDGSDSAGVLVYQDLSATPPDQPPTVAIQNNTFSNNDLGVAVGIGQAGDVSNLTVSQNNFLGSTKAAVQTTRTATVTAQNNFFSGNAADKLGNVDISNPSNSQFPLTFTQPAGAIMSVQGGISGTIKRADNQAPQANVTVFLDTNNNGTLDEGEVSTTTDANGAYSFTNLPVAQAGTSYTVRAVVASPFTATQNPLTENLTPAQATVTTADFTFNAQAATLTLGVEPNPALKGQTVTFTATVSAPAGATGTPGGTVTFFVDGSAVGTPQTLTNGVATFTTSTLTAGIHQVTASYSGDANFASATTQTPVTLPVVLVTTSTQLTVSANPVTQGQSVTFTATVTPTVPAGVTGFGGLAGTVTFLVDGAPVNTATVTATGTADATATFTTTGLAVGTHTITAIYTPPADRQELVASSSNAATVTVNAEVKPPKIAFVVGSGPGGPPRVIAYGPDGSQVFNFLAFDAAFPIGVRVATGDVNGDGIPDIVIGPGPTGGPNVKVFSGADGSLLKSFFAYEPQFAFGLFVAVADVNGDGFGDIITGVDAGGGPNVKVFSGKDFSTLQSFYAYEPQFAFGVRVAAGDVNGDGTPDIITGVGPGGGPNVKVFSGKDDSVLQSYYAYEPQFAFGVYVAAGDINGDGKADVIVGVGAGGGPNVKVFSGADQSVLKSFYAYDPQFAVGISVAAAHLTATGPVGIVTGPGPGAGPNVKVFDSQSLAELQSFFALDQSFAGGVFVG